MLTLDKWHDWLACGDPEVARTFLSLYPSELMEAAPEPQGKNLRAQKPPPASGDLF
ncbi:hypothetical protein [Ralstonia flaminis]|jgi:hypothetical protein|uniref:hypothetical protein n=1 Tax=Ralstonia flaminis TaxID=3058597 RepID=UPI002930C3A6|nr:hypothetical protein [Ralstonia sp. LMG 18101]